MSDTSTDLAIVGLGGFGRELAALVASGRTTDGWTLTAILDDDEQRHGERFAGVAIDGPSSKACDLDAAVVVTVGSPGRRDLRRIVVERLRLPDHRYAAVVAVDAHIGLDCAIGPGSVCMPHVVCTTAVTIGAHTNVMPNCTLTHDVQVGNYVAIGPGVQLAGGVTIGSGAYVGAGASVREGITIGADALVGMGSVVLQDVPDGEVWAGAPARPLR